MHLRHLKKWLRDRALCVQLPLTLSLSTLTRPGFWNTWKPASVAILVLKKGGIIIVDNVLWKGLVLEASTGDFSSSDSDAESEDEAKKSRRARKLATKMHTFNSGIVKDERVEVVVLPMRDGLSVIRKR